MICELDTVIPKSQLVALNDEPDLRSQFVTSSAHGGRRYPPYAFAEQGVAMLSRRCFAFSRMDKSGWKVMERVDALIEANLKGLGYGG